MGPLCFAKLSIKEPGLTVDATEDLLREIRDLLVPVADHYREGYEHRQRERLQETKDKVGDLLSTPTRRKAWALADGTRTQREISKLAPLDEGATSKLFKTLRELGAITGTNPEHTLEID